MEKKKSGKFSANCSADCFLKSKEREQSDESERKRENERKALVTPYHSLFPPSPYFYQFFLINVLVSDIFYRKSSHPPPHLFG